MATPQAQSRDALHQALVGTAWIAGVFCALLCGVMIYNWLTATTNDPWKAPELVALKDKLVASPKDDKLKAEIRRLDLEFRRSFRHRLALNGLGGWLLLGGGLTLMLAAKQAAALKAKVPLPQPMHEAAERAQRAARHARWSVVAAGTAVSAALLTIAFTSQTALPGSPAGWQKLLGTGDPEANGGLTDIPSLAEFQANWPRFRGPDGGSISPQTNAPLRWDAKSGAGIAWKSAIPTPGCNSPVVWSNRVFISGGTADKREVFCYDAANGQLLWQRAVQPVPGGPVKAPEIADPPGYAASTLATDGRRVYAIFATGDLAAFTLDGAPVWSKNLGLPKNPYGYATSLAVWHNRLLVQFDQGDDPGSGSKLLAFGGASGRPLWERSRPVPSSWATPIVFEAAGKTQIVTLGKPWVIAYGVNDGTELWRADLLDGEITPSPVYANGLVVAISPSLKLVALRPDGAGDVTKSHVAWSAEDNIPDIASPVSNGELVFTVTSSGLLTCFEGKTGKKIWEHELEMEVQSSPSLVGDRLFVLSTKGVMAVVEAGREFKELARNELPDQFLASPGFANGRIYLRGAANLWCVGETTANLTK